MSTKVIIVGGGIAGPVLAIFLKMKGYTPVIYERSMAPTQAGISLMMQPNGLRVLSLIPEIVENIPGCPIKRFISFSSLEDNEEVLVDNDLPSTVIEKEFGFPMIGVRRTAFHKLIIETAQKHGIEIKWGHQAVKFEQNDNDVSVTFENGETTTGSFVVGCDGLHSNTRLALFGHEEVDFTGLIQMGGVSPTPPALQNKYALVNNFGNGKHMVTYPVSENQYSWAVTVREPEAKEDWRSMDSQKQDEVKKGPLSQWAFGAGELVKTGEKIAKYGLYDRPELKTWHKGRIVLLGDAAHPTSPHLGQGANQAFEDVYHLMRFIVKYNPDASQPDTELLTKIFSEYESIRIPRSAALVKGARKQGEGGPSDEAMKTNAETLAGPFIGQSEI
ncbi:hypothetical protein SERLA73DRAFT_173280 [Serpula lacrymans var. lacrymans S7.3]|uniref:FAD-binding domain-containing protein n=1 Tax=Serpula lacrymans var. lacrymans (strain S7.3) TaxID=936435 RepID=F8QIK7_SERL3|nr:hypothetical protein SERLA73DRAFT_173280 [Serpula lacrymans var. lacrymans S7.3]